MAVREIVVEGDPVLRQKARGVRRFGLRLEQLVGDMFETMRAANGVGLAAPQVGVSERVIVIEIPVDMEDEPDAGTKLCLVNPEIVRRKGESCAEEGCLSVPGFTGEVKRAEHVTVKGQDGQGKETRLKASGLLGRVLQHEIDHLEGRLFIDVVEEGTLQYQGDTPLPHLEEEQAAHGKATSA